MRIVPIASGVVAIAAFLACSGGSSGTGAGDAGAGSSSGGSGGSSGSSSGVADAGSSSSGCSGGTVTTLASGQTGVGQLALGGGKVVWAIQNGSVLAVPVEGGTTVTLDSQTVVNGYIAADAENAYYTDSADVLKLPLSGGTVTTLVGNLTGMPQNITVDATTVYYSEAAGYINEIPIAGGKGTHLGMSSHPTELTVNDTDVFWVDEATNSDGTNGSILSAPLAGGGTVTTLASMQGPQDIAANATNVYWPDLGSGKQYIARVPVGGGVTTTMGSDGFAGAIALDGANVYWIAASVSGAGAAGCVMKAPLAGGAATAVGPGPVGAGNMAVDDTSVYYTDQTQNSVVKVTPK